MLGEFAGLKLRVPSAWNDITPDLPPDAPPTLARPGGIGVIQFSVARYQRGMKPTIDENELKRLLAEYCQSHTLSSVTPLPSPQHAVLCVGAVSQTIQELVAVWYLSNGIDLALVTYTSLEPGNAVTRQELFEAIDIVRSIRL